MPLVHWGVREPRRGQAEAGVVDTPAPSAREAARSLLGLRTYRHLLLGPGINAVANYAFLVWAAPFLMRVHDMGTGAAGTYLGLG